MMKKSILSLSAALALSGLGFATVANAHVVVSTDGAADALALNPAGSGHMLYAPYYSAQNGNATFVNIVNTDSSNGKAVKVRFRGAANSDDVLDFTLFLSPGDVWSGMVSEGANGFAQIETNDVSCTAPPFPGPVSFSDLRLGNGDVVPDKAAATREGYLEVLNMADIPSGSALYTTIKHVKGVAPCDWDILNPLAGERGTDFSGPGAGLSNPTGGLMGSWAIANLADLGTYSGNMTALAAHDSSDPLPANGAIPQVGANINYFPQLEESVDSTYDVDDYTADPLMITGNGPKIPALWFDLPDMSTPLIPTLNPTRQVELLQGALGKDFIQNEWVSASSPVAYGTDWVISQPTRRYYTAVDYGASTSAGYIVDNPATMGADTIDEEGNTVPGEGSPYTGRKLCTSANGPQIGMNWQVALTDREEYSVTSSTGPAFSPGSVAAPVSFCGEVAVLKFGENSVLNASQTVQSALNFSTGIPAGGAGWGSMNVKGAPVVGFAAIEFKTDAGTNFGQTFNHSWRDQVPTTTP